MRIGIVTAIKNGVPILLRSFGYLNLNSYVDNNLFRFFVFIFYCPLSALLESVISTRK